MNEEAEMEANGIEEALAIVLFSGTDDKLTAATVLAAGAAAIGRPVHVFLQYWGLEAFLKDRIDKDHGASAEAGPEGQEWLRKGREAPGYQHWAETLRQAREIGDIDIQACALSMDLFGITKDDLDPMVDGVEGVVSFLLSAQGGQIVFI
jgi:peroxiredoxin family protein